MKGAILMIIFIVSIIAVLIYYNQTSDFNGFIKGVVAILLYLWFIIAITSNNRNPAK